MTVINPLPLNRTRERVRNTLRDRVGDLLDQVGNDDELREALGDRYDSLAAMEFVSRVEAEFGVEVDFVSHDVRFIFSTINRVSQFVAEALEDRDVRGTDS
ncbi:acyl carrier protein [Nocardia sp. NPDC052566]|uniref:acyl carrier protein n=1 Tax=Nocardia sp. NPDC052566 TaxID=3364330 RepID=UPI0037CBEF5D